jgi:molecular chaperone DnaK
MAADNRPLGQFDLVGIPPSPRGMPQIEVTFDIDANGIVSVGAKDKATNKEQSMRIQPSGGLSEATSSAWFKEAEEHAGEDKARRELAKRRTRAKRLIHNVKSSCTENGDKIPAADKTTIEQAIASAEGSRSLATTRADIAAKTQPLVQASMKIGEAMYGGAGPGGDGGGNGGGSGEEGVVDADFEEVDGKKSA